jgi:hypothetical protein
VYDTGRVAVELRDFRHCVCTSLPPAGSRVQRKSGPRHPRVSRLLLRPTQASLAADADSHPEIHALYNKLNKASASQGSLLHVYDAQMRVEAALIHAAAPPLSLDPSPATFADLVERNYARSKMTCRIAARCWSQRVSSHACQVFHTHAK